MRRLKKNSRGSFTINDLVSIALASAIVVIFGVWMWYCCIDNARANQAITYALGNKNSDMHESQYLEIPELGIKIGRVEGLEDMEYYFDKTGLTPRVRVSTQSLKEISYGACDAKYSAPFGWLKLAAPGSASQGQELFQTYKGSIYYLQPQSTCGSDELVIAKQAEGLERFKKAVRDNLRQLTGDNYEE